MTGRVSISGGWYQIAACRQRSLRTGCRYRCTPEFVALGSYHPPLHDKCCNTSTKAGRPRKLGVHESRLCAYRFSIPFRVTVYRQSSEPRAPWRPGQSPIGVKQLRISRIHPGQVHAGNTTSRRRHPHRDGRREAVRENRGKDRPAGMTEGFHYTEYGLDYVWLTSAHDVSLSRHAARALRWSLVRREASRAPRSGSYCRRPGGRCQRAVGPGPAAAGFATSGGALPRASLPLVVLDLPGIVVLRRRPVRCPPGGSHRGGRPLLVDHEGDREGADHVGADDERQ